MPSYQFTESAASDLDKIVEYTLQKWGIEQALQYIDGLEKQAQLLADMPSLARSIDKISSRVKIFPYEKHHLYFVEADHGITIIRVLHQTMSTDGVSLSKV